MKMTIYSVKELENIIRRKAEEEFLDSVNFDYDHEELTVKLFSNFKQTWKNTSLGFDARNFFSQDTITSEFTWVFIDQRGTAHVYFGIKKAYEVQKAYSNRSFISDVENHNLKPQKKAVEEYGAKVPSEFLKRGKQ